MKSRRILGLALALGAASLFFAACQQPTQTPSPSYSTIQWQTDGQGYLQFSTNDPQYYKYGFYDYYDNLTINSTNKTIVATVKKLSGSKYGGYGVIFCYTDKNNRYTLVIDQDQEYSIQKKINGTFTTIIDWTTNTAINNSGENTISITRGDGGIFNVIFNNKTAMPVTFTDTDLPSGLAGPYASVNEKPYENFPSVPVDVRIKFTQPAIVP